MKREMLLIFDGDCGFCTMTAGWVEKWTGGRVEIQPWQWIPERLADVGLTAEDGMRQVWTVGPDGTVKGGAAAVNAALAQAWWARPLTWLYRLPGIKQLEERAYRWVADHRYRLPGGAAACAVQDVPETHGRP